MIGGRAIGKRVELVCIKDGFLILNVSNRTSQEEWRNYLERNETANVLTNGNPEDDVNLPPYTNYFINIFSGVLAAAVGEPEPLSSKICAIIHGSLLAGLFFFAITR